MQYYALVMNEGSYIKHHGILGQKWGIRRYQNKDGSLTEEGKKRYAKELEKKNGSLKPTDWVEADNKFVANGVTAVTLGREGVALAFNASTIATGMSFIAASNPLLAVGIGALGAGAIAAEVALGRKFAQKECERAAKRYEKRIEKEEDAARRKAEAEKASERMKNRR